MNINGIITLFPKKREIVVEGVKKEITDLQTTISSKDGENYINKKVDVKLSTKAFPEEKVNQLKESDCYKFEIFEGFLAVRGFKDSSGKDRRELEIVVTKGKLLDHKAIVKKESAPVNDDLPF